MNLKALLLSSDERIVRVLRRTLGDLEISVEHCSSSERALRALTRDRFEAIIVDCVGEGAAAVLKSARNAPCNKRAVAVAILESVVGLRTGFDIGAHFVLYKPVSPERARSSFRAARALMKKERRRNSRINVRIPVEMSSRENGERFRVNTSDLGEGGLAVALPRRLKPQGRWQLSFTLPGMPTPLEIPAELAWEGTGTQVGLRFVDVAPDSESQLRDWLSRNLPDVEKDDPPVPCQLTDLSLGGCYLDLTSPFPVSTRVMLSMSAAGVNLQIDGVVRVMHPEHGMGIEFTQRTPGHREKLQRFLSLLTENRSLLPELFVEPDGWEPESASPVKTASKPDEDDALLGLFRHQPELPADSFMAELRKQRGMAVSPTMSL